MTRKRLCKDRKNHQMLPKEYPVWEIKSYVRCLPAVWSKTCSTKCSLSVRRRLRMTHRRRDPVSKEAAEDDAQTQGPCEGQAGGKEAKVQGTPSRGPAEGKDQAAGVHSLNIHVARVLGNHEIGTWMIQLPNESKIKTIRRFYSWIQGRFIYKNPIILYC